MRPYDGITGGMGRGRKYASLQRSSAKIRAAKHPRHPRSNPRLSEISY